MEVMLKARLLRYDAGKKTCKSQTPRCAITSCQMNPCEGRMTGGSVSDRLYCSGSMIVRYMMRLCKYRVPGPKGEKYAQLHLKGTSPSRGIVTSIPMRRSPTDEY